MGLILGLIYVENVGITIKNVNVEITTNILN